MQHLPSNKLNKPYSIWRTLAVVASFAFPISAQAEKKPNFLFISIDDLRPQLGAYGLDYMITPHLDKFASNARVFNRHYVQVATCGPSRASLLTGKNLTSTADINHWRLARELAGTTEPTSPETFVHHFKQNGYQTIGMGKISHSSQGGFQSEDKKFGNELPHSWSEFIRDPENKKRSQNSPLLCFVEGNFYKDDKLPFEKLDVPDESYPDGRLAELAKDKLKKLSESDQPFFMAVGFYKPHLPFTAPQKYWDLYDRSEIKLSPNPGVPKGVSKVFLNSSFEFFGQYRGNREKGGLGKQLSKGYAQEVIHANYAATSYVDVQVGKVLDQLEAVGLADNTIVVVWSDHGWCLGDHSIWGKHSVLERALRSVLMVRIPGMSHPGELTNGLVASIDIYPTLCEMAELSQPQSLDGTSFLPLLKDPKASGRKDVLSYWRDTLSLRTDRYRMSIYHKDEQQEMMLFDHQNDTNETVNVAADNPEVVKQMISRLREVNNGYFPEFQ